MDENGYEFKSEEEVPEYLSGYVDRSKFLENQKEKQPFILRVLKFFGNIFTFGLISRIENRRKYEQALMNMNTENLPETKNLEGQTVAKKFSGASNEHSKQDVIKENATEEIKNMSQSQPVSNPEQNDEIKQNDDKPENLQEKTQKQEEVLQEDSNAKEM